ncbi:MAG: tRNA (adenine-N1)-methyltransferase [Methanobacteriaceae archaeon]|nr:tRNA (adenine-N1)-methyltransferase [Methanobacteriaceae archaeon]
MRILIDSKGRKYLAKDDDLHTDAGYIKKEEIENSSPGDVLETHLGKKYTVLEANINDYIDLMERRCSIILPKDMGIVAAYTGLGCGNQVLDAGTGAGATAIFLANIVGPQGHVYSYEIREDFAEIAKRNIEGFGLENVAVKCQDLSENLEEKNLDLVFLDLPKPWLVADEAHAALKTGGFLANYTPFVDQVMTLHHVLKKVGFSNLESVECLLRGIEVKSKGTRPKTRMTGHTGYLTFARKL